MHLNFMTRGPKNHVDEMINQLRGVYLPWKCTKDGIVKGVKKENYWIQMRVCPIQLWDISFPREYQDVVLNTLLTDKGKTPHSRQQKFITVLRKCLGLKKIPDYKTDKLLTMRTSVKHTDMIGIGIKPDKIIDGTEMI